jgi:Spy/CpxP family protein refolding chaperone
MWTGLTVLTLALSGAAIGVSAWAQKTAEPAAQAQAGPAHEKAWGDHPFLRCFFENGHRFMQTLRELNLTPDQKKQVAEIFRSHKPEAAVVLQALKDRHDRLVQAVRSDTVNEGAIRSAGRDMADAIGDAAVLRAKVRQEVRAVLTPEQRQKVDQALASASASADQALREFQAK